MSNPKASSLLVKCILYSIIAVGFGFSSVIFSEYENFLKNLGIIITAIAMFNGLFWFFQEILEAWEKARRISTRTKMSIMLYEASKLDSTVAKEVLNQPIAFEFAVGMGAMREKPMLIFSIQGINDTKIPIEFALDFVENSTDIFLTPIRNYSQGSKARELAISLTGAFVAAGWANEYAGGPAPSAWIVNHNDVIRILDATLDFQRKLAERV